MKSTLHLAADEPPLQFAGNPTLIQSHFGHQGDFEVVVPLAGGDLAHLWRNNDLEPPNAPAWSWPICFGKSVIQVDDSSQIGQVDALALIQSNFRDSAYPNYTGNFEVVARMGNQLEYFWWDPVGWHGPYDVMVDGQRVTGVAGTPSLIQSRFGTKGNFELVVPLTEGGLGHFFRDNDALGLPWKQGQVPFGTEIGQVDAVSLIQSNFHATSVGPGNLELVARVGDRLAFFYKEDTRSSQWKRAADIAVDGVAVTSVSGNPALIQSRFGNQGNFELVVPLATGGLGHFFRDNDTVGLPWKRGHVPFGADAGQVDAVSLIQSNYHATPGGPGNLELITRIGNRLAFFFLPDAPPLAWTGPLFFA